MIIYVHVLRIKTSQRVHPHIESKKKNKKKVVSHSFMRGGLLTRPGWLRHRVPRMGLAHGPLAEVDHDVLLHLVDAALEVVVVPAVLGLAVAVEA